MNKYGESVERNIGAEHTVREWTRSGLLEQAQLDQIVPALETGLRRTNVFLRLILFGFSVLIIAASLLLIGQTLDLNSKTEAASLCFFGAIACIGAAEILSDKFRLYRFGVEEAAASASVVLLGAAGLFFVESVPSFPQGEFPEFVGLVVAAVAACAIFLRFGYVYAAIAAMLCISLAPFQLDLSEVAQRLVAAAILLAVFVIARSRRQKYGDDFPGDRYGTIQAAAILGVYACLNVMLIPWLYFAKDELPRTFYWFTYVVIWILPIAGLYLATRNKDRPLLDISLMMTLGTLVTNKPYLGLTRETWDPILFGLFLIGIAAGFRRWLSSGEDAARNGFTASRILNSDRRTISVVGTLSVAAHSVPGAHVEAPASETFHPGGGRSGGAGASGSF